MHLHVQVGFWNRLSTFMAKNKRGIGLLINPQCACAARVVVVLPACVSVCYRFNSLYDVQPRNNTTCSGHIENQFECRVFCENASLLRSAHYSYSTHTNITNNRPLNMHAHCWFYVTHHIPPVYVRDTRPVHAHSCGEYTPRVCTLVLFISHVFAL